MTTYVHTRYFGFLDIKGLGISSLDIMLSNSFSSSKSGDRGRICNSRLSDLAALAGLTFVYFQAT